MRAVSTFLFSLALLGSSAGYAQSITSSVVDLPVASATQRILHVRPNSPVASLVAIPGGDGTLGIQNDGSMGTRTAACGPPIRNRNAIASQGIAMALVDANSLGVVYGQAELLAVVQYMKSQHNVPVWIIGGSASTPAAANLATQSNSVFRGGVVFFSPERPTTSVTSRITRPAYVISHSADAGAFGSAMFNSLTMASPKEREVLSGGNPGNCGYHLFDGLDNEFVAGVTGFIRKYNPSNTPIGTRGAIDIDGDGKNQIVVRNTNGQMQIGRFANDALQFTSTADPGSGFRLVGIGDFDANGRADLAYQDMTQGEFGDIRIWPGFSSTNPVFWRQVKQVWDVQAVGDLDGDGFADLVWRYVVSESPDTGVSYIWFTNGSSVTQVRKRGGAPLNWQLLGAMDLNGDSAADMLYLSPTGQLRALMATPNRTCANLSAGAMPAGYSPLRYADFTGNGRGDVLLRNSAGNVQLLSLNASGLALPAYTGAPDDQNAACTSSSLIVSSTTITLPDIDPSWQFYASGDLNGDGVSDIVWRRADGTLTVWLMVANSGTPTVVQNAGSAPVGFNVFRNGGPTLQ